MLGVIEWSIANCGQNLPKDEEGKVIQVVGRAPSHDNTSTQVEYSHDDSKKRSTPFVDAESEPNAEEGIDLNVVSRKSKSKTGS